MKMSDISLRNKISRHSGAAFENLIDRSCAYYAEKGIAKIEKTPEPVKILGRMANGIFKAVFTKQAQPDYKGTLSGGLSIVIEAKHTDTDRIRRNVISVEQEAELDIYNDMGADCHVLVSFGLQSFYMIPWHRFRDMRIHFDHQYINRDDERLKRYEVKIIGGVLRFIK